MSQRPALLLAATLVASAAAAALPEKEAARVLPLVGPGEVSVKAYKGTIRVRTWDRSEVGVKARVVADESCGDASERVQKTRVVIEEEDHGVSIRADYDRVPGRFLSFGCSALPFVHFEIFMPRKADLRVKDYKSRIDVEGLEGDLKIDTYKSDIRLARLEGGLDLTTYKGEVRVETALRKGTSIETQKADVTLTLPRDAPFTLQTTLGRKASLESDFPFATGVRRRTTRTSQPVNGGGPLLSLETHKGDLRLRAR